MSVLIWRVGSQLFAVNFAWISLTQSRKIPWRSHQEIASCSLRLDSFVPFFLFNRSLRSVKVFRLCWTFRSLAGLCSLVRLSPLKLNDFSLTGVDCQRKSLFAQ